MTEYVYEVCDTSNDEMYYPLGIFLSLDDAKAAIEKVESAGKKVSEYSEEYEQIEVREKALGWSEHGKAVLTIQREDYYDEEKDEYLWRRVAS